MHRKPDYRQENEKLEREGRFDVDYILPVGKFEVPDKNFRYEHRNVFYRIGCVITRTIACVLSPLLCKIVFGLKVKGRENLKGVKSAISIVNHVHWLDTLFVKQAIGHYRSYHTGAKHNNKKGFGGFLMRQAGFLPFSDSIAATKNLYAYSEKLLAKGAVINFCPEQAMWINYRKPRPFKSGAFKFAVKFNVPIVPLFVTYEDKKNGGTRTVINILKPLYPAPNLNAAASAAELSDRCFDAWKNMYEKAYGISLVYLNEETDAN